MAQLFGTTKKGEKSWIYRMKNQKGMEVLVSDYGASIVSLYVPDRQGHPVDVVLGYDSVEGYEQGTLFFGGVIGRVANRIGGARFLLNGNTYPLTANDHGNTLHGGRDFTNQRIWETLEAKEQEVTFSLVSPNGDQGFPGEVQIQVTYALTDDNELRIRYQGKAREDTVLNLTNHSYFNLAGHASGSVEDQEVQIQAQAFTRTDACSIPTGEFVPVDGTPMDFRRRKKIGKEIEEDYEALSLAGGYDHNYVLDGVGLRKVALMYAQETGIAMEVSTDLPGMQFYTANFVAGERGKEGAVYEQRSGACFETQYFPDSVNQHSFETPLVRGGEMYDTVTVYRFVS